MTCVYTGCSTHKVPSWSKVAMRSSGGANFGLDWSVVAWTNSFIADFAAPSFHDGSGSVCAKDCVHEARPTEAASRTASRIRSCNFMAAFSWYTGRGGVRVSTPLLHRVETDD